MSEKTSSDVEIRKILVAYDRSEPAMKAFNVAQDLAKKYHAQLMVVTAVELSYPDLMPRIPRSDVAAAKEDEASVDRSDLEELVRRVKDSGIDVRAMVLDEGDSPVNQIVNYAEREGIDLIVTGTRGLGGVTKLLLGSVSSGLVSRAHCHVLVVK